MVFELVQQRAERLFKNRQSADAFKIANTRPLACRTGCIRLGHGKRAKRAEAGPAKCLKLIATRFAKRALAFAGSATNRTKSWKAKIQQIIQ